jgi:tRNA nucleotidyltransferase (CCA-adding enzyme)
VDHLTLAELEEMLGRFNLSPKQAAAILRGKEASEKALIRLFRYGEPTRPQIYHLLAPLDSEFILYMMAKSRHETSRKAISLYFTHLKHLKPELKGRDLVALGYQPGPLIKEMLDRLLEARLNEKVKSRTEERDFIRRYFGPA